MKQAPISYRQISLFDHIGDEDLDAMLVCLKSRVHRYRKGEFILLDQDQVQNVGVVLSGTVHMLKEDLWGHKALLTYMGPGELFGETFAFAVGGRSYVSFFAATEVQVLFLSLAHLFRPCKNNCAFHAQLVENAFRLLGEKNVQLMEKIEVTSKNSLREKILAYLSLQAQKQGQKYIHIPLNRTEMASFLQSNRSAMARELAAMKAEGLIDYDGNTFVLRS